VVTTAKTDEPGQDDPFLRDLIGRRNAKGLTTRTLAEKLGVSAAFVSLVENGQKVPGDEVALEWAKALDVNPNLFAAWARSKRRSEPQTMMLGEAEYRYWQHDPNVQVQMADLDQIGFESISSEQTELLERQLPLRQQPKEGVLRVPLFHEGADPDAGPKPLEYITVQEELLQGERLVRPFAYRISSQGVLRVSRTLHPGDYAVISRQQRHIEPEEIYAIRVRNRIVLSRVMEKGPGLLLLMSDQGQGGIDVLNSEDGRTKSLIAGKVVVAIRALQYSVVKPVGRGKVE
jgi:transcriptional regulator with XRE-family HTH domain